jgi:hypothetical protein
VDQRVQESRGLDHAADCHGLKTTLRILPDGVAPTKDPTEIGAQMSEHLNDCDPCSQDHPCDQWDRLFARSQAIADNPGEVRARMRDHLQDCEVCSADLPCLEWDELYARFESVGGDPDALGRSRLPEVQVVTYKTPRAFQLDANLRVTQGWTTAGQTQETGQTHRIRRATNGALIGGLFMMPLTGAAIGGLSNKRTPGAITVTWVKAPVFPPDRSSAAPESRAPETGTSAIASHLTALADLHRAGVLTDDEFLAKKAELLARM